MAKSKKNNLGGGTGKLTVGAHGSSKHDLFVIDDESLKNPVLKDKVFCPVINGEVKGHGFVKRDYAIHPVEMFDPPSGMPVIPRSEYDARIKEHEEQQSSIWHVLMRSGPDGGPVPPLDQGREGFCWYYSTTMAVMILRAMSNQPYVRFSAHAGACKVMNFQNRGGWCGLSAKHHREVGCPSVAFWPEKSMSRAYDKPETWANAALHKVSEEWVDLTRPVHSQNLLDEQINSCLLSGIPVPQDYDEWEHSICGTRLLRPEAGSYAREIINSWGPSWGNNGFGIIRTSWTIDGAVALRVTGVSPN